MPTTNYHMALSVRGALMSKDRDLKGWIRDDAGRLLSPQEARAALMDELANGNEFVPFGKPCDDFDPKSGCRGHPVPPNESVPSPTTEAPVEVQG